MTVAYFLKIKESNQDHLVILQTGTEQILLMTVNISSTVTDTENITLGGT